MVRWLGIISDYFGHTLDSKSLRGGGGPNFSKVWEMLVMCGEYKLESEALTPSRTSPKLID